MTTSALSYRDRAVLRAVAAGRCRVTADAGVQLLIDGLCCCDQFLGARLCEAGLIASDGSGPARLTESGQAVLAAA